MSDELATSRTVAAVAGGCLTCQVCYFAYDQVQRRLRPQGAALRRLCECAREQGRLPRLEDVRQALGSATIGGDGLLSRSFTLAHGRSPGRVRVSGHEGIQLKANSADGQPLALVVVGRDTPLDAQQEENWKELSEFMKGFRRRTNVVGIHDCGCFDDKTGFFILRDWLRRRRTLADVMEGWVGSASGRGAPSRTGSLSAEENFTAVALGVARGLSIIHDLGFCVGEFDERSIVLTHGDTCWAIGDITTAQRQSATALCNTDLASLGRLMKLIERKEGERRKGRKDSRLPARQRTRSGSDRGLGTSRMYRLIADQLLGKRWSSIEKETELLELAKDGFSEFHINQCLSGSYHEQKDPRPIRRRGLPKIAREEAPPDRVTGAKHAHEALLWLQFQAEFSDIEFSGLDMERKLGEGGFGVVYLASWHQQHVAVKSIHFGQDWMTTLLADSAGADTSSAEASSSSGGGGGSVASPLPAQRSEDGAETNTQDGRHVLSQQNVHKLRRRSTSETWTTNRTDAARSKARVSAAKSRVLRQKTWQSFRREIQFAKSFVSAPAPFASSAEPKLKESGCTAPSQHRLLLWHCVRSSPWAAGCRGDDRGACQQQPSNVAVTDKG